MPAVGYSNSHTLARHLYEDSAAKPGLLRPRQLLARSGARIGSPVYMRTPQPNPGCCALANCSRDPALALAHPFGAQGRI